MKNMIARKPQIGRYKIFKTYREMLDGVLSPVAEVIFMEFGWNKFDLKLRKVRLRSLYNKCSVGPKDEYPIEKLDGYYLIITDMYEIEHPTNPDKINHCVLWDVVKPCTYDEEIQLQSEIEMDFVLQEINTALNHETLLNELNCLEMDEILNNQIDHDFAEHNEYEEEY